MLTEDEARKKICCGPEGCGDRLMDDNIRDRERYCIASECMAWEWFDSISDDGTACHHKPTDMLPRVAEHAEGYPLSERRGDCGLKRK